jgi:hypothetical protein
MKIRKHQRLISVLDSSMDGSHLDRDSAGFGYGATNRNDNVFRCAQKQKWDHKNIS